MIKASVIAFPMFVAIVLVLFVVGVYRFTRESAPIRTTGKVTYGRCSERSTTSLMLVKTVTQSDGTSEMWLFGSDGKRVYPRAGRILVPYASVAPAN